MTTTNQTTGYWYRFVWRANGKPLDNVWTWRADYPTVRALRYAQVLIAKAKTTVTGDV